MIEFENWQQPKIERITTSNGEEASVTADNRFIIKGKNFQPYSEYDAI